MTRTSRAGSLVKTATHFVAQVEGGERLVLQAVKGLLDELRDPRRKNASCGRFGPSGRPIDSQIRNAAPH